MFTTDNSLKSKCKETRILPGYQKRMQILEEQYGHKCSEAFHDYSGGCVCINCGGIVDFKKDPPECSECGSFIVYA